MDVEKLIDLAKNDTTPSIEKLSNFIESGKDSLKSVGSLYKGLDDLKQTVQTVQENKEGFLRCNTKEQQQLLEECCNLLKLSESFCIILNEVLGYSMKPSGDCGRVDYNHIQGILDVDIHRGLYELHILTMSLDLLVKVMQL